mgnify:CR=1 FL=1
MKIIRRLIIALLGVMSGVAWLVGLAVILWGGTPNIIYGVAIIAGGMLVQMSIADYYDAVIDFEAYLNEEEGDINDEE